LTQPVDRALQPLPELMMLRPLLRAAADCIFMPFAQLFAGFAAAKAIQAAVTGDFHQPGLDLVGVYGVLVVPELHERLLADILRVSGVLEQIARQGPRLILVLHYPMTESS